MTVFINMSEEEQIKGLVKENFLSKLRKGARKAFDTTKQVRNQAPDVIKRESRETKIAMRILLRILKRQEVTDEEITFLKKQTGDVAKALGLLAGGVISIPLTVALTAYLEKKGVSVLPQENDIDLTEERLVIMEQAMSIVENEVRERFEMPIPNDVMVLNDIFARGGFELYVVGGAVRDALQGTTPKDYDLASDAKPQEIVAMLQSLEGYNVLEAGATFPVVHCTTPDHVEGTDIGRYEIATFRLDIGADHTKPKTQFATIDQDAYRRDLTINALYYDLDTKEIIDFVGGLEDIRNGVIRMVGDATQRFDEHRIRVLRAIRFAARMGSPLDPEAVASLQANNTLGGQPAEAIMAEFLKGIKQAKITGDYLNLLGEFNLFGQVLPNLRVNLASMAGNNEKDPMVVMALILQFNEPKDIVKKLKSAKYPNDFINTVAFLVDLKDFNVGKAVKAKKKQFATVEQIEKAIAHGLVSEKLGKAFLEYLNKPRFSGDDAEAAGIQKNTPEMGKWLAQAEAELFTSLVN